MKTLSAVDAKVKFGAVLDAVEAGEEVVVTRNGRPVARIVPIERSAVSKEDAVRKLAGFGVGRALDGLDLRALRDEGRR